eukprot:6188733-Pleurochrysis_carterae.AAC.1
MPATSCQRGSKLYFCTVYRIALNMVMLMDTRVALKLTVTLRSDGNAGTSMGYVNLTQREKLICHHWALRCFAVP